MNRLIQWFKSSSKMKRWMLLILVGMILICFGMSVIISKKQMSFKATSIVVVTFVIGFLAMVVGLVCLNKRSLEVLI